MKNARESNIELLRIITICGVVVLHYNGNFALQLVNAGTANYGLLLLLEALFICGVDLFVLISGYFLCTTNRRKAVKVLELVVQVILFGMAKYLVGVVLGGNPFSVSGLLGAALPNNYYVTLYLAVYLISPYINIVLNRLSDKQFTVLVALWGILFAVLPTLLDMVYAVTGVNLHGMYPIGSGGSQYGYNFLNFLFMYLIGAYLRRAKAGKPLIDLMGMAICLTGVLVWQNFYPSIARAYCNPFVIGMAVFVFRLFTRLHFSCKAVNALAKGAFTCFLLHDFFLPHIGIDRVVNRSLPVLMGHIILCVPLIFLLCWVAWRVYAWVTDPIFHVMEKPLSKLDGLLSPVTENKE